MPTIIISVLSNQTVGQPLTLECNIFTVRGVNSQVDIIWRSNALELKNSKNINASTTTNHSILYADTYTISQLSTAYEGRTYQCDVLINSISSITAYDNVTLNVTGKKAYTCL